MATAPNLPRREATELEQVQIRFWLPRYLRRELRQAARAQTLSMSSLLRVIVLDFVRARHNQEGPPS